MGLRENFLRKVLGLAGSETEGKTFHPRACKNPQVFSAARSCQVVFLGRHDMHYHVGGQL